LETDTELEISPDSEPEEVVELDIDPDLLGHGDSVIDPLPELDPLG